MCALQLIQAKNTYLCKAPTIGLKTTPDQLESNFEDVDKLLEEFEMVASCILVYTIYQNHNLKSEGERSIVNRDQEKFGYKCNFH